MKTHPCSKLQEEKQVLLYLSGHYHSHLDFEMDKTHKNLSTTDDIYSLQNEMKYKQLAPSRWFKKTKQNYIVAPILETIMIFCILKKGKSPASKIHMNEG